MISPLMALDLAESSEKVSDTIEQQLNDLQTRLDDWADFCDPARAAERLKRVLGQSSDLVTRWIQVPSLSNAALMAYFEGLVNTQQVETSIVKPLLKTPFDPALWADHVLTNANVSAQTQWHTLLSDLPRGKIAVFAPGLPMAWVADAAQIPSRSISTTQTEREVRGPKEAFSTELSTQIAQMRSRIDDPTLRVESFTLGLRQHKRVAVLYLEYLANPELIQTVRTRIQNVMVDAIPVATTLAGIIRDHPHSIFPTIRSTEHVDVTVERLLEGKVAILVDKDPFVLIAPSPLADFYRTAMDYTSSWVDTSFVRFIRFGGWAMGIYLPAIYIAAAAVNPNLVPFSFQVMMIGSHTGMPFPPVVETFMMIFVIEVLREAALRLPKDLSTTIGTVGAIVVGTAVVRAGLVSPQVIVIITLTALSFFTVPVYELTGTWRIVNFAMLIASAILGFWGIIVISMLLIGTLCQMQSFGAPYFSPWAPFRWKDWKDLLIRVPWTGYQIRLTDARPLHGIRMTSRDVTAIPALKPPSEDGHD